MIIYRGPVTIDLNVNGVMREVTVRPADTLLQVLRGKLGLTGAKAACENGDCGACTVLLNGDPIKSCLVLAVEAEGAEITTIEGLSGTAIQKAFLEESGFQCGFCTPGFIVNAYALLQAHPDPDKETIRDWLESNLCRCTGYEGNRKCRPSGEQKTLIALTCPNIGILFKLVSLSGSQRVKRFRLFPPPDPR